MNDHTFNCNCNNHGNLELWIALIFVTAVLLLCVCGLVLCHWHTLMRYLRNQVANDDGADLANSDMTFHSLAMRPASTNTSQEQLNEGRLIINSDFKRAHWM